MDSLTNDDQPGLLGLENYLQELEIHDSDLSQMKLHLGHMNRLRRIRLVGNDIPEIEDDWLSDLPPSLKDLQLTGNSIRKIGNHAFSRLNKLRELTLTDNRFGPVKRSMFPDNLMRLNLSNNSLTDLPVDLFTRMPRIDDVFLEENRLTTLDERTWSPIWQQLEGLYIDDNNIVCDDGLNWIKKSLKVPRRFYGRCSAPEELKDTEFEDLFGGESH